MDNENDADRSIHALLNYDKSKGSRLDVLLSSPDKPISKNKKGFHNSPKVSARKGSALERKASALAKESEIEFEIQAIAKVSP